MVSGTLIHKTPVTLAGRAKNAPKNGAFIFSAHRTRQCHNSPSYRTFYDMNDTTAKLLEAYQHVAWVEAAMNGLDGDEMEHADISDALGTRLETYFNQTILGTYHVHPKIIYSLTERTIYQFILTFLH